jgi:hypothetical protein
MIPHRPSKSYNTTTCRRRVDDCSRSVTRKPKVALVRSVSSASEKALSQYASQNGFSTPLYLELCYMNDNGRI